MTNEERDAVQGLVGLVCAFALGVCMAAMLMSACGCAAPQPQTVRVECVCPPQIAPFTLNEAKTYTVPSVTQTPNWHENSIVFTPNSASNAVMTKDDWRVMGWDHVPSLEELAR